MRKSNGRYLTVPDDITAQIDPMSVPWLIIGEELSAAPRRLLAYPFGWDAAWGQSHWIGQSRRPLARRMIVRICASRVFGVRVSPMLRR
jgi:hypothetical protein